MTGQSRREELQDLLEALLGSENVYFQPPEEAKMIYPAIRYSRDNTSVKRADNQAYFWRQRYEVMYLAYVPDSDVIDKLVEFPYSEFNRHFETSGLNHDVFEIYY